MAENDLLGARELDDAVATEEAFGLATLVVVGPRLAGNRLAHRGQVSQCNIWKSIRRKAKCHNVRPDPTDSGMVSP